MWVSIRGWRCQKAGRPSKGHGSHHRSHEPRRDISQFNLAPPWRGNPGTSLLNIAFARLLFRPPQAAMLTMLALARKTGTGSRFVGALGVGWPSTFL
jgi:hypothetical protein